MRRRQFLESEDTDHGLIGSGKVSYTYTVENKSIKLVIYWHLMDKEIIYTGNKAKNIWSRVINDSHMETINHVKKLACESVGIPLIRIKEKSRKQEVVWARNMVFWYVNKILKYSLHSAGDIFGKDHATALHGIREFNKENKYQKERVILWKKIFLEKCINRNLMI